MTKLEELKVALSLTTPGEWDSCKHAVPGYSTQCGIYAEGAANDLAIVRRMADADFICVAHNLMPDLLEAVELLRSQYEVLGQVLHATCYELDEGQQSTDIAVGELLEKLK